MEPQASKLGINILIIVSIILIAGSLFVTSTKQTNIDSVVQKPSEQATQTPEEKEVAPVVTDTASSTTQAMVQATTTASTTNQNLFGKTWKWSTKINDASKKADTFTMTFGNDGKITGKTDCNSFFGTYTSDGTKISFGQLGTTRMFCEKSIENEFLALLEKVTIYSLDTNKSLTLTSGTTTMVFK